MGRPGENLSHFRVRVSQPHQNPLDFTSEFAPPFRVKEQIVGFSRQYPVGQQSGLGNFWGLPGVRQYDGGSRSSRPKNLRLREYAPSRQQEEANHREADTHRRERMFATSFMMKQAPIHLIDSP